MDLMGVPKYAELWGRVHTTHPNGVSVWVNLGSGLWVLGFGFWFWVLVWVWVLVLAVLWLTRNSRETCVAGIGEDQPDL
jgi:hypothetical protein